MSGPQPGGPETPAPTSVAAPRSTEPKNGALLFRIVGLHVHQAVLGERIFTCERETTNTEGRISVRWLARDGGTLLKGDCPTLNHAKKLCRAALREGPSKTGSL